MQRQETLSGPDGLRIELDAEQIFPEDPGQGTPALVIQRKGRRDEYSSTYNCASDQGTLENTRGEFLVLSKPKCDWLNAMETYVDRWLTHFSQEAKAHAG